MIVRSIGVVCDELLKTLWIGSAHSIYALIPLHAEKGGHGTNFKLGGEFLVLVDIDLDEDSLAFVLLGDLLKDGLNHLARGAPGGGEVNEDGEGTGLLDHLGVLGSAFDFENHLLYTKLL